MTGVALVSGACLFGFSRGVLASALEGSNAEASLRESQPVVRRVQVSGSEATELIVRLKGYLTEPRWQLVPESAAGIKPNFARVSLVSEAGKLQLSVQDAGAVLIAKRTIEISKPDSSVANSAALETAALIASTALLHLQAEAESDTQVVERPQPAPAVVHPTVAPRSTTPNNGATGAWFAEVGYQLAQGGPELRHGPGFEFGFRCPEFSVGFHAELGLPRSIPAKTLAEPEAQPFRIRFADARIGLGLSLPVSLTQDHWLLPGVTADILLLMRGTSIDAPFKATASSWHALPAAGLVLGYLTPGLCLSKPCAAQARLLLAGQWEAFLRRPRFRVEVTGDRGNWEQQEVELRWPTSLWLGVAAIRLEVQ